MSLQNIAAARRRVEALTRRPETGLSDDAPASATWRGGLRIVTRHANGTEVASDMPAGLGGSGDRVSPAWLFRAGLAACASTSIVLAAAAEGIALAALDVRATSRSDARGLLGVAAPDGTPVPAAPIDLQLQVHIAAADETPPARLRALVETALRRSPIPNAVRSATPLALFVQTEGA